MMRITRGQKLYFAAVGLLALWVGFWGYFIPTQVDSAIPWLVPPLHARFLGSMYLSGATFMLGSILARSYAEVRDVVPAIAIWTGMLLVVSFFYLGEFDYSRPQVWIWFGAYILYPLIALWLMWQDRNRHETVTGSRLPNWVRSYLLVQGIVVTTLAVALLLLPDLMLTVWPWKITRMLAQLYSAPFLSFGLISLMLSRRQTWHEVRVAVTATLVFVVGVLLASFIHLQVFSFVMLSAWLWFLGFGVVTVVLGLLSARALRVGRLA
jgi:hypothetical protein